MQHTEAPNLDNATDDDLRHFLFRDHSDDEIRAMCGTAPGGAPRFGVLDQMKEYAKLTLHARRARTGGKVDAALRMEESLQRMYDALPDVARW